MDEQRGEDEALLARIARSDRSALEQLYRRSAPWLTMRLQTRCSDEDLVDIAVQDTFVAVWRKPGTYKGQGAVAAWLWGIAIRRLIDQLRPGDVVVVDRNCHKSILHAIIMTGASVISKLVSPGGVIPIGIVTALIGVPFLFFLIMRGQRRHW